MTDGDDPSHRFSPRIRQELDKLPLTAAQKDSLLLRLLEEVSFLDTRGGQRDSINNLQPDSPFFEFSDKMQAVLNHFHDHGLTRDDYLKAAIKNPHLFNQAPATVIGNIETVAGHFRDHGMTLTNYLNAILKKPEVVQLYPATIIANIETVADHFRDQGMTLNDYLKAAIKHPQLFYQKPATIIANIETMADHFRDQGLILPDYLRAAVNQPQLFCQLPDTIIGHVNLIIDLHRQGLVRFPGEDLATHQQPLRPLFNYLVKNPAYFTLADDNFTLRNISAHVTGERPAGTALLYRPRHQVEQELGKRLGRSDPGAPVAKVPPPSNGGAAGSHARNVLLRALIREGFIKGALDH